MNRILYEKENGSIGKVMPPSNNTILVGGTEIHWRKNDASNIPYTGIGASFGANVSAIIDVIITRVDDAISLVKTTERLARQASADATEVINQSRKASADLGEYVRSAVESLSKKSHNSASSSIVSNPALTVDKTNQSIKLDLSASGSFDDSRTGLGVSNVQAAFLALANKNRELEQKVQLLTQRLDELVT
jgi:hypothetical protein